MQSQIDECAEILLMLAEVELMHSVWISTFGVSCRTRKGFHLITHLQQIKDCSFTNGIGTLSDTVSNHTVFPQKSIHVPVVFHQPLSLPAVHFGSDVAQLKQTEKALIDFSGSWIML